MRKKPGPKRGQGSRSIEERFWDKVDKSGGADGCWPWTGSPDAWGYGRIQVITTGGIGGSTSALAHRVSWGLANGPIPDGLVVRHDCDNPPCVRPDHLRLGTPAENAHDRDVRGRLGDRRGEANHHVRLTETDVRAIRAAPRSRGLAEQFGISPVTVQSVRARRTWKHLD